MSLGGFERKPICEALVGNPFIFIVSFGYVGLVVSGCDEVDDDEVESDAMIVDLLIMLDLWRVVMDLLASIMDT